ncbi:MAG: CBS domain-containing protein, partial [Bacteroidota bacterium]
SSLMTICCSGLFAFAMVMNMIFPGAHLAPGAFALVGMAAVFGAASRATFTFIIFAFEMTHDYNAILPLMLVCVLADGIALTFMRNSIMTEKLARRGVRVHQEYEADLLQQTTVADVMDPAPATIPAGMLVGELAGRIARREPEMVRHQALPIVDDENRLVGIVTRGDLMRAMEQTDGDGHTVAEAGADGVIVAYADEILHDAVLRMMQNDVGRLPVVDRADPAHLVGYLGRSAVMKARLNRHHEENTREPGWLPLTPPLPWS